MWDRYDVRDSHRDRDDECDRNFGSRGGTSERERNDERDPRVVWIWQIGWVFGTISATG